jgi:16S rRNA processing protein RimM
MTAWDDMFVVARVARAHGNRGQVILDPETDFPDERFKAGSTLFINRGGTLRSLTIESVRFHRGRPILSLSTVATMDDAEALAGHELRIEPEALQQLPGGSFYHHDLIGCRVQMATGQVIGTVTAIEGEGPRSRLVVTRSGDEVLIPLAEGICVSVDVARGTIVVDPPEGLLELNETRRQRF